MPKKNDRTAGFQQGIQEGGVVTDTIENLMPSSMLPYAEFVILDRALPRVEDGLKPVQRRILYTMYEMGLTPDKPHKKSARIVGDCMGKYHPHGDSSVYDAMVRMAQDFNMRMTLVDGHGNFGSVDGDPAAAMRYTEARLQPLALELLRDLDKETVPFSFNFDDTLLEPDILPGRFPNLLVNGANGIAVGLATNIPTHNLTEVIDGACAYIDNPRITLREMMKIIPGPDFSTGGYIIANELTQAYETGKGKITLRARFSVENGERGQKMIVITELPYQTNKAELLRKIMLLREDKKDLLDGITDIVDESDRQGMRAVVYCRKDADMDTIISTLLKYTDLECTFGMNMVAIAEGRPQQMGLLDILRYYTQYQRQVVLRRARFDLREAEARCHIVEGLIIGVHNIDEVVRIIKSSESTSEARKNLMEAFSLTERQAQAILDLRLARLAKLEIKKLEDELEELHRRIAELKEIIESKARQMEIVKDELREIKKKYRCERKTTIVQSAEEINVSRADIRRTASTWAVCVTGAGNIKFADKDEFDRAAKRRMPSSVRPDALMRHALVAGSEDTVMVFTNKGKALKIPLDEQLVSEWKDPGTELSAICSECEKDEKAVRVFPYGDDLPDGDIVFFTRGGSVKRTPWKEYNLLKPYYDAVKLKDGDEVISVENWDGDECSTMCFVTRGGMCLNASKDDVPVQGRVAGGVRGILLNEGDEVVMATQHCGEGEIVVGTTYGTFKRVISSTIDILPRSRKGVMIADVKGKGEVLFSDYVTVPYAVVVFNEDGTIAPINTEDIPIGNRVVRGKTFTGAGVNVPVNVISVKSEMEAKEGHSQLRF